MDELQSPLQQGNVATPAALLDLQTLVGDSRPGLTAALGRVLAESAMVCLELNGHTAPLPFSVIGLYTRQWSLTGPDVTNQMQRTYGDWDEAVEWGASSVALLVMEQCEALTVYRRSPKNGGGFDYYLIPQGHGNETEVENFFAAATAWLEVSGILSGTTGEVQTRLNAKMKRFDETRQQSRPAANAAGSLPTMVIVVEFSAPLARIERYD